MTVRDRKNGENREINHPISGMLILRHLLDPQTDMPGKKSNEVCGSGEVIEEKAI